MEDHTTIALIHLHAANRELRAAIEQIKLEGKETPYWLVSPCKDEAKRAIEAIDITIDRVQYIRETVVDEDASLLNRIIIPSDDSDI